jgi:hypothetical protein
MLATAKAIEGGVAFGGGDSGTSFVISRRASSSIPLRILQRKPRGIEQLVYPSFADASVPAPFAASTPRRGRE